MCVEFRLGLELLNLEDNLLISDSIDSAQQSDSLRWFAEVANETGGKYEALGSFVNEDAKTRVLHTTCGYEYDIAPDEWRSGRRCWRCSGYDLDPSKDEWRREVDADMDRYTALGSTKGLRDSKLIRHDACLFEFNVTTQRWRDGARCYKCPPIQGRMHKTRNWRKEVYEGTEGEYRAIGDYTRPDRNVRVIHLVCGYEWNVRPGNWRARESRCPQCAESTGDNDAVYIWRKPDRYVDGRIIVKIGSTSWRLGQKRIKTVAWKHNTQPNILGFEKVEAGTANDVEARILRIGEQLSYSVRIDGSTEFRLVHDEELERMVRILKSARRI